MGIIEARCTSCGAPLKVREDKQTITCDYCHNTVVVSHAKELGLVELDRTRDIKKYRENLSIAVRNNSIDEMLRLSGMIKDIIPNDFSANYYFSYAKQQMNQPNFMYQFLQTKLEYTKEEYKEVFAHISIRSELRDKLRISTFIKNTEPSYVSRYEKVYTEREQAEDNYAVVPRDVFVCFSSLNMDIAEEVVRVLEEDGNRCWISTRNLRPDDSVNYWKNIEEAIDHCDMVLVVSSAEAMVSQDVLREVKLANEKNKKFIEFKIDDKAHNSLFKYVFDGNKWIKGSKEVTQNYGALIARVYDEKYHTKAGKKTIIDYIPKQKLSKRLGFGILSLIVVIAGVIGFIVFGSSSGGSNANTVVVEDTTAPTIELKGDSDMTLGVGQQFIDPGVIIEDDNDENIQPAVVGEVDNNKLGAYIITYYATDSAGNQAQSITRTIHVVDDVAPIITMNGKSDITVEAGNSYSDLGALVNDNYDDTVSITKTGSVNTSKLGDYTITYTAMDLSGNEAIPVTRTVHVVDTTAPIITLNGNEDTKININTSYNDMGVTVSDNYDQSLQIDVEGSVDTTREGTYIITYQTRDSSGNQSEILTRTVEVIDFIANDHEAPIITINGDTYMIIEAGSTYQELGAVVTDNYSQNLTVDITGSVDTSTLGTYQITYTATDEAGNEATPVTRTVIVQDTTAPTITLNGEESIQLSIGSSYTDPGVTVSDNYDLTDDIQIITTGSVDINTEGTYTITYQALDSHYNQSTTLTRNVVVKDYTLDYTWNLLGDGTYEITGYIGTDTDITIPSTKDGIAVTSIGEGAFDNIGLTNISLPEGLVEIGVAAFAHNELTSFIIPASVSTIERNFVIGNPITEFIVEENSPYFMTLDGVLFSKDMKTLVKYPEGNTRKSYIVPDDVEIIGSCAIAQTNLESITLNDGLLRIEGAAFSSSSFISITIPSSVEYIGYQAFSYGSLETLVLNRGNLTISGLAFQENNLQEVFIPSTVTLLDDVFKGQTTNLVIYAEATSQPGDWGENWNPNNYDVVWGYSPSDISDFTFNLLSTGTYEITGYIGTDTDITIPSTKDGIAVTSIGESAFENTNITSVVVPSSIQSIGDLAFYNDTQLNQINLSEGLLSTGRWIFANTGITQLNLPSTLINVELESFAHMDNCTDIFVNEENPYFTSISGVLFSKDEKTLLTYPNGKNESVYEVPIGTEVITNDAFAGNQSLNEIILPNTLTSIKSEAFISNINLQKIIIPISVIEVGNRAFANDFNLTIYAETTSQPVGWSDTWNKHDEGGEVLTYWGYTGATSSDFFTTVPYLDGLMITKYNTDGPNDVIIPSMIDGIKVYAIGDRAFDSSSITSVFIPDTIIIIGECAFIDSSNLVSVIFEDNSQLTSIEQYAFKGTRITSIAFPEGLQKLGENSFSYTALENVFIPASVTTIEHNVFVGSVKAITVSSENPYFKSVEGVLYTKDMRVLIAYPSNKQDNSFNIPDTVVELKRRAFGGNHYLENITLPEGLTTIQQSAFAYSAIREISIPSTVNYVDKGAFSHMTSALNIYVDENNMYLTSLNGVLFSKDMKILKAYPLGRTETRYEIPNGVEIIELMAFQNSNLSEVILPSTLLTIEEYAFADMNITSITIPGSVIQINSGAFIYTPLTEVIILGDETRFNDVWEEIGFPIELMPEE